MQTFAATGGNLFVPVLQKERGWSVAALQAGAQDSGLSPAAAGLIAGGGFDLIQVRSACHAPSQASHSGQF